MGGISAGQYYEEDFDIVYLHMFIFMRL